MQMPQPTDEHRRLEEHCGVWDVDCTFYMDPSQPPMKMQGKETFEMFMMPSGGSKMKLFTHVYSRAS
jgi:hypothetical protein